MATLRVPVSAVDHTEGPADAPVTLVEYGDYECPHCGRAFPIVKRLQRALRGRLRFVFRNFPLTDVHPHAAQAAAAAEAAARQGQFWAMHDLLFGHQQALDDRSLRGYAGQLGLDLSAFDADRRSADVQDHVADDLESGARSGVNGTPTFFANGTRVDGGYDYDTLLEVLRALDTA
jgi:protein-disulfide isomerase